MISIMLDIYNSVFRLIYYMMNSINSFVNHMDHVLAAEDVSSVFRSLETGVRSGEIQNKDLKRALKMLGVNPLEQEIMDITNEIGRNGFIHFSSFCQTIYKKYRIDNFSSSDPC